MSTGHRLQAGVTLIELLIALAVMAVLMGLAAPAFHRLTVHTSLNAAQVDLLQGLRMARLEAVNADTRTVMCPTRDGRHCRAGIRWGRGWLIAYDRDHDGAPDGMPIHVHRGLTADAVIIGSKGRQRIHYHANGSAPGSNVTLTFCSNSTEVGGIGLVVSNSGRIRRGMPDAANLARCRQRALAQQ